MKKLSNKAAILFERFEPWHQCLILFSFTGFCMIFLVTVILMML